MKEILCAILLNLSCLAVNAQSYFRQTDIYDMRLLNQQSGLNNNTLTGIHQDANGFMWLGTDVGLNRYDGIQFHNYAWQEEESATIGTIIEDAGHLLWCKIEGQNRIACFDKMKGRYLNLASDTPGVLEDIRAMTLAGGKLYVATGKGIAVAEAVADEAGMKISFRFLSDTPADVVRLCGSGEAVYALTAGRELFICRIDSRKRQTVSCRDLNIAPHIPIDNMYTFNGYVWVCPRWSGGVCYDPATGRSREVMYTRVKSEYNSTYIRDIVQVDKASFIVAARNALYRLSFDEEDFITSAYHIEELSSQLDRYAPALNNGITKICYDADNSVLWVGTFGRGVLKLNMGKRLLQHIGLEDIGVKVIKTIMQDAAGYIWLATEQQGIFRSVGNELSPDLQFARWPKVDVNHNYCMHKDKDGGLWIGCSEGNVLYVNPISGETIARHPRPENGNSIGAIYKLYRNMRGLLCLATEKGFAVYDPKNDKVLYWAAYSDKLAPVTAVCEDGDGMIWLGTEKGLITLKYRKNGADIVGGYEEDAGLRTGKVLAIYVNNYNQIFVSYVNKILQIDGKEKKVVSKLLLRKDFENGHVNCMIDDGNGNTWLGTNAGLLTVNNKSNASYTYSFPENYYEVCLLNNGYLLWASSGGLSYFDPHPVKEFSGERKLYISDIDVNYRKINVGEEVNGQVILDKPVYHTARLDLNHLNNNLVVYLSDLKYGNVSNRVEYRLLPVDEEWKSSKDNQVTLSNLGPGDYKLEIRPVSPLEVETEATVLDISVGEYWAATPWAVVLYILSGSILSFAVWNYFTRKKMKQRLFLEEKEKLERSLEEERRKREEDEKINRKRDQARLILAQELRTPLSLIIAPLKEIKEKEDFPQPILQKVEIAYRSSLGIRDICNRLLSIYQHKNSDDNVLRVAPYRVMDLTGSVVHSFYELLNSCPITLHYDKEKETDMEIWIDRKRVEFILQSMFSNACRHISYSGSIWFAINKVEIAGRKYCRFMVRDDGKHVEESFVARFGKTEEADEGTSFHNSELALDVMKEMASVHGGDIMVERTKDVGTTVTLCIPLGKEHFAGNEQVAFVEPEKITLDKEIDDAISALPEERNLPAAKITPLQPEVPADKKHTLLIIEDYEAIRIYLNILFASAYNVLLAENGEEGVQLARSEMPDLIITDIMMPKMDGFECCRILKEDLSTCHIPIILLTALSQEEDIKKGIELGADEYIYKPFNPEILRLKVSNLIKNRMELKRAYAKLLLPAGDDDNGQEDVPEVNAEDPLIEQILELANQNLRNPEFSVKWLAEELNMSQATLYRRIKQLTDFSLVELIRGVRLKRAAELLRTKKYSVQEVAEMVGYNDVPTFRKHFVDFYGTTPSTFNNKTPEG